MKNSVFVWRRSLNLLRFPVVTMLDVTQYYIFLTCFINIILGWSSMITKCTRDSNLFVSIHVYKLYCSLPWMCLSRRLCASISCDPQVPISIQLWSKCCVPFRWHILVKDASVVCASLGGGLQDQYNRYLIPVYFKRDHHLSYTYMSAWEMLHRCRAKNGRGKNSALRVLSYIHI